MAKTMVQKLDTALKNAEKWTPEQRAEALCAAGVIKKEEISEVVTRISQLIDFKKCFEHKKYKGRCPPSIPCSKCWSMWIHHECIEESDIFDALEKFTKQLRKQ